MQFFAQKFKSEAQFIGLKVFCGAVHSVVLKLWFFPTGKPENRLHPTFVYSFQKRNKNTLCFIHRGEFLDPLLVLEQLGD